MTDLAVIINGAGTRFTLIDDHRFEEAGVTVPAGYRCDFATIPKIVWSFGFTPLGRHQRAALLHDYLYDTHHALQKATLADDFRKVPWWAWTMDRHDCDRAFLAQMKRDGVGWRSRWTMYIAVRLFGGLFWNKS
jgi:hypothetical protein